jgi:all-trans-8'-apo-beta-carotenal 15,15'-oxygenase
MTAHSPSSAPDHAPLLERAFDLEPWEGSQRIERITGRVPDWLRGAYYVNGPGRFRRGDVRYGHWLDGDGLVQSLRFTGDGVRFTSRFVRSAKLEAEEEAGRARYRCFGTSFEDDELIRGIALASPVNVSVYPVAGKLLAFGEQGLPWELDAETLETLGEHRIGGLNPVSPFSAHPCFDPSGEVVNFGVSFSAQRPLLHVYRFGPEGDLRARHRLPLDHPRSVHDFALSPTYAVFYLAPYLLDMGALAEGKTVFESLSWRPEVGSVLRLVERETGRDAASVELPEGYCLHLIGAFEADDELVVDVLELDRPVYDQYLLPDLFHEARMAQPVRYRIDPSTGSLRDRQTLPYQEMCDFPAIDPRRAGTDYGDFWVLGINGSARPGRKFFDHVLHCDWHRGSHGAVAGRWDAPQHSYLGGEPVFAGKPGDLETGAILCQRFDAQNRTSSYLVFDAFDLTAGPVAELHLEQAMPLGFHAAYEGAGG